MKYMRVITTMIFLAFSVSSFAKSPVFKISKDDDYIYIGGTIHLLSPSDYPLPQGFKIAFDDSVEIFFEADAASLTSSENQVKMAKIMTYADGRTLENELKEETFKALEAHLAMRQIPAQIFEKMKPAAASLTLTVVELQRLGLGNQASGVDQYYSNKARDEAKRLNYLESVDQQLAFIDELNKLDADTMINSTLADLNKLSESWTPALQAWRNGDIRGLGAQLGADKMQEQFPAIYQMLLTDRNNNWLAQIEPMFNSKDIELLLVGALHLSGETGLIKQLKKSGYTVEQLD